jgi:hypothetical protein
MTLTFAPPLCEAANAVNDGAMYVEPFPCFATPFRTADAASGSIKARAATPTRTAPRPLLPQRAFERESPPRLPVPQSALLRSPCLPRSVVTVSCSLLFPGGPLRSAEKPQGDSVGLTLGRFGGGNLPCVG